MAQHFSRRGVCARAALVAVFLTAFSAVNALADAHDGESQQEEEEATEYLVIYDSHGPLGLQLGPDRRVLGFQRVEGRRSAHTHVQEHTHTQRDSDEARRRPVLDRSSIRIGDVLVAVQGKSLESLPLSDVQAAIARAALPKALTFSRTRTHTHTEEQEQEGTATGASLPALATRPSGIHGHPVFVDVRGRSVTARVPGMQGMFGGAITCTAGRVVLPMPRMGCGAYAAVETGEASGSAWRGGADALEDAVVVVQRGGCSFAHKAAIATQYGARGLLVLNNEPDDEESGASSGDGTSQPWIDRDGVAVFGWKGRAPQTMIRMPADPAVTVDIALPAVLLPMRARPLFENTSQTSWGPLDAVIRLPEQNCVGQHHGRLKPNATSNSTISDSAHNSTSMGYVLVFSQAHLLALLPETLRGPVSTRDDAIVQRWKAWLPILHQLRPTERMMRIEYAAASFGQAPSPQLLQLEVPDDDRYACRELQPASRASLPGIFGFAQRAILAHRGKCSYAQKASSAMRAGWGTVIVGNDQPGLVEMAAARGTFPSQTTAVMVAQTAFDRLQRAVTLSSEPLFAFLVGDDEPGILWKQVLERKEPSAWPSDAAAAHRMYGRLALVHHPDTSSGDMDRFHLLQSFYEAVKPSLSGTGDDDA